MSGILGLISSSATATIAKIASLSGAYIIGVRSGENHVKASEAAQIEAAQDEVIARQQAMAAAQADSPRTIQELTDRLGKGQF